MLALMRAITGVDAHWLRHVASLEPEHRVRAARAHFAPFLEARFVRGAVESPLQLMALGVNYAQRDRMLRASGAHDLIAFLHDYIQRLAATDLHTNWFAWYGWAGHFDHERQEAVPPYLRRTSHEASTRSPTVTRFHHRDIFDVLRNAKSRTWSHYTLCDAIDWMPTIVQRRLVEEILRTARDGAIVLWRSVERFDIAATLGFGSRLVRLADASDRATQLERTQQYARVDFYRVAA
jgi:S-adenosylmethionine-diacylglycerol 3-amino-3-carboxypropyl transferase